MSAAPTTTPATTAALAAAATAAASALPSPTALQLGPTDGSLSPDGAGSAVVASFTGALSGSVAIIVDPSLEAALAGAEGGALSVAEALQPALEAAGAASGPAVLGPVELEPAGAVVAREGLAWAPLVGDGEVLVWVGLRLTGAGPSAAAPVTGTRRTDASGLNLLRDVQMTLTVELGRSSMPVRDLLSLAPGSVVELDRAAGAPADLLVNGRLLARGEIVVVDEDYGLRITEIVDPGGEA